MDARDRLCCTIALVLLVLFGITGDYEHPDLIHLISMIAGAVFFPAAFSGRRVAAYAALTCALFAGIGARLAAPLVSTSDVMLAIDEALRVLHTGGNPYAHAYVMTRPPGQLFPYPPGTLAFYGAGNLLAGDVFNVDRWAGLAILALLTALLPIAGAPVTALVVTLAALARPLIDHASSGSNDIGLAFLITAALVLLAWSRTVSEPVARRLWWSSALVFGWALAFKETSAFVLLPILFFLRSEGSRWRGYALAALGTAAVLSLPFIVRDPVGFWNNVAVGPFAHTNIWGRNLWSLIIAIAPDAASPLAPIVPFVMVAGVALAVVVCWRRPAHNLGAAILQGCALLGSLFVLARWTTATYFDELIPVGLLGVALVLNPVTPARDFTFRPGRRVLFGALVIAAIAAGTYAFVHRHHELQFTTRTDELVVPRFARDDASATLTYAVPGEIVAGGQARITAQFRNLLISGRVGDIVGSLTAEGSCRAVPITSIVQHVPAPGAIAYFNWIVTATTPGACTLTFSTRTPALGTFESRPVPIVIGRP